MTDLRSQLQSALGSTYTLERELGGGGMSRTFIATETALARRVVIKVLAPELLAGISIERFKREVLLAAQLQHPHIVPVLASGDANGLPWFTMPYVEGESLRHRLGRGPLGLGEIIGILRDVARALEFAHSRGVVHRDIKPDNVLIAGSSATVTDFGIAKAITAARTGGGGATLTMAGTTLGTPAYMPPEQAAGDPDVDQRSDIYSFGAMAYELLAGHAPFVATSPAKIVAAHFNEVPRPISALRSDTPATLATLVMSCLEKEPAKRPQSAGDVVRILETVSSSSATGATPLAMLSGEIRLGKALALWAAPTALVALVAWAATKTIGLPEWVLPGALGVTLAGAPVIVLTWFVQRANAATPTFTPGGSPSQQNALSTLAVKASPHLSWRRTWIAGGMTVAVFVLTVIGYMVLRALGIGPAGSLMAAGKLGAGETMVVADFAGPAGDSALGSTVAEALRTDLRQSGVINVMTRATMTGVLALMQRQRDTTVDFNLAREIATREGARAVLDGTIVRLGNSYVVSARLVSGFDGTELANFSATADDENDLVRSLGRLSKSIRSRIGESLKTVRDAKPLERVTTPSLPALRKYVEAVRQADELGNFERGIDLLEEAVVLDTSFAMGWRKIAVLLGNLGVERPRELDAASRAFRHRARLSEMERLLTEGYYYSRGREPSRERALAAYEAILRIDSTNATALNNAALRYLETREYTKAADRFQRALNEKRPFGSAFTNLMVVQLRLGRVTAAESTQVQYRSRLPAHEQLWQGEWNVRWGRGELDAADSIARATISNSTQGAPRIFAALALAIPAYLQGKLRDGLHWRSEANATLYRATDAKERLLIAAFDSAFDAAHFLEDSERARAIVRRALVRTPMSEIPPASRPWDELAVVAAKMRDAVIARQAAEGFEQDLPNVGSASPDGERARMRGWAAFASNQYADAIAEFQAADREFAIGERLALIVIADAFDLSGQRDSALTYYERFIRTPDLFPGENAFFVAGAHKRIAELYEVRGDTGRAEAHYQLFIDLWKDADAELQPIVRSARNRLAQLQRQRG